MCMSLTADASSSETGKAKAYASQPTDSTVLDTGSSTDSTHSDSESVDSRHSWTAASSSATAVADNDVRCDVVARNGEENGATASSTRSSTVTALTTKTRTTTTTVPLLLLFFAGTTVALVTVAIARELPFWSGDVAAARATYHYAYYQYHADRSYFDTTVWTYGTDYALACATAWAAWRMATTTTNGRPSKALSCVTMDHHHHPWRAQGLLACYWLSVLAGGWAHQTFVTLESRNTSRFVSVWNVCVGAVAVASGYMGASAAQLVRAERQAQQLQQQQQQQLCGRYQQPRDFGSSWSSWLAARLPHVPDAFWIAYAATVTVTVVLGGFSFQRPACDIFIVGITQFPSTAYMMLVLATTGGSSQANSSATSARRTNHTSTTTPPHLPRVVRVAGCAGFILNAPLLPLYPILVQRTDWTLASVNTLLHAWLLVAWSLQGWALRCMYHHVNAHASHVAATNDNKVD